MDSALTIHQIRNCDAIFAPQGAGTFELSAPATGRAGFSTQNYRKSQTFVSSWLNLKAHPSHIRGFVRIVYCVYCGSAITQSSGISVLDVPSVA